jgi:hypothetical protein
MSTFEPCDVLHFEDANATYVVSRGGHLYSSRTESGFGKAWRNVQRNMGDPDTVNGVKYVPPVDVAALPVGSVVLDGNGDLMAKATEGWLLLGAPGAAETARAIRGSAHLFTAENLRGSIKVVFQP